MERFRILFDVHTHEAATPDQVDGWAFAVLDELIAIVGVIDADLTADLGAGRVWYEFLVEAGSLSDALADAAVKFRAALHAVGTATPGMEEAFDVRARDADQPMDLGAGSGSLAS